MPRIVPVEEERVYELGDLLAEIDETGLDPRDEENFVAFGPALKRLANNKRFLGDIIVEELKARCSNQSKTSNYSPQVIMLHRAKTNYVIRANIWPAAGDAIVRASGTDPFLYNKAHDHNFSFLTVGYVGPGYWSDYYEYDRDALLGYPGEAAPLRYVEKSKLDEGKVMLYRIHRDVHVQLPADELSVSLNILEMGSELHLLDQYEFDVGTLSVRSNMSRTTLEPLLAFSARFGGGEGADLIESFARSHPSDAIRFHAVKAMASAADGLDARAEVYARAARGDNPLVAAMARQELAQLEKARAWIAAGPDQAAV